MRKETTNSVVESRVEWEHLEEWVRGQVQELVQELLEEEITEFLVIGLAKHIEEVGRPLCPCNFYEDKQAEAKNSTWICACDEMQKWKYCH